MRRQPRFLYGLQFPLLRKKSKPENSDFYKAAPAKRRCGFCKRLAKQATYAREAWRICTRFACTGRGRRPDAPWICPAFSKAGKMFPIGNDRAARPSVKPRSGALNRGLQNLETPLHAQRAAPTGANFLLIRKFPKGNGFILFASAKRTKKQPGLRPATSVQIAGRAIIFDRFSGFRQTTGYE